MRNDSASQGMLESAELPSCHKEQKRLHDAHFNYQQVIGEAIYAMVTCRQIFVMLSSNSHNTLLTLLRSCSYVANGGTRKFGACPVTISVSGSASFFEENVDASSTVREKSRTCRCCCCCRRSAMMWSILVWTMNSCKLVSKICSADCTSATREEGMYSLQSPIGSAVIQSCLEVSYNRSHHQHE